MEFNPELLKAGTTIATEFGKNSAAAIRDRIKSIRTSKGKDEVIEELQEIIGQLIDERSQLVQLSQAYEEELITQKISDEDIDYITEKVVPLLEDLLEKAEGEDTDKIKEGIEMLKPILSEETFNILQLVGFNFKNAIGQPLTQLVKSAISSNTPVSVEKQLDYQILIQQKEIEYWKVIQDEEAFERHMSITDKRL